jgi:hypothetical protein
MYQHDNGVADTLRMYGSEDGQAGGLKHLPKLLERSVPDRVSRKKQIVEACVMTDLAAYCSHLLSLFVSLGFVSQEIMFGTYLGRSQCHQVPVVLPYCMIHNRSTSSR